MLAPREEGGEFEEEEAEMERWRGLHIDVMVVEDIEPCWKMLDSCNTGFEGI